MSSYPAVITGHSTVINGDSKDLITESGWIFVSPGKPTGFSYR